MPASRGLDGAALQGLYARLEAKEAKRQRDPNIEINKKILLDLLKADPPRLASVEKNGEQELRYVAHNDLMLILRHFSTTYPVLGLCPLDIVPAVERLLVSNSNKWTSLSDSRLVALQAPVLHKFIRSADDDQRLEATTRLLQQLLGLAKDLDASPPPAMDEGRYFSYFKTGYEFPTLPIVRLIDKKYPKDKEQKLCAKYGPTTSKFMPGCMICICLDCDSVLGFHVMPKHESPRTVFEILFTRWRIAPSLVVYDNACNLQRFALFREHEFFKNTHFVLDKLHFYAHARCSSVYNPYKFRELDALNTQVCEQLNSRLKVLRAQLSRFSLYQWLFHIRMFFLLIL